MVEATRGNIVESIHFGAISIADKDGNLVASAGDPNLVTFLRSSSKPFQVLPLIERGGVEKFDLTEEEVSVMCASHIGTDKHVAVVTQIQDRLGIKESDLLCGTHLPYDSATQQAMLLRGEAPTPRRHNCSGKHTGFLAHALIRDLSFEDYVNIDHPLQKTVIAAFAEMCDIDEESIEFGIDGCSVPVFAIPLQQAARGFARLADPSDLHPELAAACKVVTHAMYTHPDMVSGPGQFDTRLMEVGKGKFVVKGGAEGYQSITVMPNAITAGSPALGLTHKVADGDRRGRARPVIGVEILRQLGALSDEEYAELADFHIKKITNARNLEIGDLRPCFKLEK